MLFYICLVKKKKEWLPVRRTTAFLKGEFIYFYINIYSMLITIVTEASSQCALLRRVANTVVIRSLNFATEVQFYIWFRHS